MAFAAKTIVIVQNFNQRNCLALTDDPRRNLALGKPTSQIDTYDDFNNKGYWHNGSSQNAVDGNLQTDAENRTCIRTRYHHVTWWMVDLQDYFPISELVILAVDGGIVLYVLF